MSSSTTAPSKALTDDEAGKEMKKMVAFIMQEAGEKAREIQVKADEEFNVEKAKMVRQETMALEQQYGRKLKQVEVRRRVTQSANLNKSRLRVLQARDAALELILHDTKTALLAHTASDQSSYQTLMNQLALECLCRLMEEKVAFVVRKEDLATAQEAAAFAAREYRALLTAAAPKKETKKAPPASTITVDEAAFLPANSGGGIMAVAHGGRIRCDNTLNTRLEQSFDSLLPEIRVRLFGHSPSRRFFD